MSRPARSVRPNKEQAAAQPSRIDCGHRREERTANGSFFTDRELCSAAALTFNKQEKFIDCGTKAANMLDKILADKYNATPANIFVHLRPPCVQGGKEIGLWLAGGK